MRTATHAIVVQPTVMNSPPGFAELYEQHYATVYRAALRITGNPADAEDALQTVFLRLLTPSEADPVRMPSAYFRRAAVNAAVDLLRRRAAHAVLPFDDAVRHPTVAGPGLLKERLRRAIATLEAGDAEVFLLRYVEGLTNGELAEMFGQEKNNIAVRLHRIRQALQVQLER